MPEGEPTQIRNVEILKGYAARPPGSAGRRISLKFLRSPIEILGDGEDGPVTGIRLAINRLRNGRAVPTGDEEVIGCGLVLRSIGYRGRPVDDIPFDERRALIRNEGGRVCDEDGSPCGGEYAVGWIKRGPSGVIGTNKKDAADTVAKVVEDREAGRLRRRAAGRRGHRRVALLRRAGRGDVGGLAGDRRARALRRRAPRPPAGEAGPADGPDGRRARLARQLSQRSRSASRPARMRSSPNRNSVS